MNLRKYNFIKKYHDLLYLKGVEAGQTDAEYALSAKLLNGIHFSPRMQVSTNCKESVLGRLIGGEFISETAYLGTIAWWRFIGDDIDPLEDGWYAEAFVTPAAGQIVKVRKSQEETQTRMFHKGKYILYGHVDEDIDDLSDWHISYCEWRPLS